MTTKNEDAKNGEDKKTSTENILNVTLIEPRLKHPTIFSRFDELNEGESLTIHNDHDPKPLYYQLLGERGNIFTWEYLEQGPEWWKVKISKRITGENDETLGQIAAKDLRKAQIFKKYGLDFCCGGKKTVKEACAEKGLDVTKIEQELQQTEKIAVSARPLPYNEWELDFLADYIVNTHHSYVKKNLPDIVAYANKVFRVHGSRHPELQKVNALIEAINGELSTHLVKEEKILFPYIKNLVAARNNTQHFQQSPFGTVQNPVNMMEIEHEMVGKYLAEIRTVTNNYEMPEDACASYSLLYRMLPEFEDDLHTHIHLENNILFPKAAALEKVLLK
ncbi:MAG: iron-sulfur cluster repair di-iron protein [Bacteroidetes bacterium]|nr:iron-sulfur cluster repair di-iron protein [Bacteroidota bacterium]